MYSDNKVWKTYDRFNLSIFKSPPTKPRLFCPNDFFVYVSGKTNVKLSRQIAEAEQDEGTMGDRFGKVGTLYAQSSTANGKLDRR